MKSMLILTDFSDAAFRAAEYAINFAGQLGIEKAILYHAYRTIAQGTDFWVPAPKVDNQIYIDTMEALGLLHDQLENVRTANQVKLEILAEDAFLPERINSLCKEQGVSLVAMGVSGKSNLDSLFMGSNTSQVLKESDCTVLIVPNETVVKPVESVAFATDVEVFTQPVLDTLATFLNSLKPGVYVIDTSVDKRSNDWIPDVLKAYQPQFFHTKEGDVVKGALEFASQHKVSMIITVPQQQSFLSSIFHKSISKELAYNARLPLLSIPSKEK
ncbi:Nucleotide-binding universal stress protein, UspA family [Chitinophaga terrae (ex Kim and Jung 2007)]|uniref:Nucleotide-binding universal stress protein, UspA family n=1 Tax=Chitinophaga terrae (ex Kim and Jung 2007) TaxID=408074 RepID=A0A1H4GN68_9BACT|nr:universal stress protein [Chitinophaga terrae (ex Kim and Jung 2007)]SEB11045.1 Nucleotide-binding universal stress protein, UspA family [Chitinophaga terrae (ex Kim and Jung 2007)]